jgi:hypothetical protein
MNDRNAGWAITIALVLGFTVAVMIFFAVCFGVYAVSKKIGVWGKEQAGRAALAEAGFSKQVQVEQAKANLEAERLNAEAEIVRAEGAAKAITAEAGGITENYIRYLWVRQQENLNDKTVIYIPTEAGLPILEAGRNQ